MRLSVLFTASISASIFATVKGQCTFEDGCPWDLWTVGCSADGFGDLKVGRVPRTLLLRKDMMPFVGPSPQRRHSRCANAFQVMYPGVTHYAPEVRCGNLFLGGDIGQGLNVAPFIK